MANKVLNTRIINKHDLAENWEKATNFVPYKGELIIYDADTSNPAPRLKIGDGDTVADSLPFLVSENAVNAEKATIAETSTYATTAGAADTATIAERVGEITVGGTNKPIYLNDGVPTEISFEINKDVPSNAVFTDTTYEFDGTYNAVTNKVATISSLKCVVYTASGNPLTAVIAGTIFATGIAEKIYADFTTGKIVFIKNGANIFLVNNVAINSQTKGVIDFYCLTQDTTYRIQTIDTYLASRNEIKNGTAASIVRW